MFSLSLMPTFKQVEPQHLQGLTSGHVLSQLPVSYTSGNYGVPTVAVGDAKYIENGIIVKISNTGTLEAYKGEGQAFLHYDEELDTSDFGTKSGYAVLGEGAETYIRAIALFPGDEFVTDQVNGVMTAGTAYTTDTNGVIANTGSGNGVQFLYVGGSAFETTLPNGKPGYHFVVLG